MPIIATIPEMFFRISCLKDLADLKAECSTMLLDNVTAFINLADPQANLLLAACLYERYADILTDRLADEKSCYYQYSIDYFFQSGSGFEASRVQQKVDELKRPTTAMTQLHSGALFSAPAPANSEPKKTHDPYAPVLELW